MDDVNFILIGQAAVRLGESASKGRDIDLSAYTEMVRVFLFANWLQTGTLDIIN